LLQLTDLLVQMKLVLVLVVLSGSVCGLTSKRREEACRTGEAKCGLVASSYYGCDECQVCTHALQVYG
jgi:hypothetical protein